MCQYDSDSDEIVKHHDTDEITTLFFYNLIFFKLSYKTSKNVKKGDLLKK